MPVYHKHFFKNIYITTVLYYMPSISLRTPLGYDSRGVPVISILFKTSRCVIPLFQNEWKPGARVGAHSIMGSFGGEHAFVFNLVRPQMIQWLSARPL